MPLRHLPALALVLCLLVCFSADTSAQSPPATVRYSEHIQPLLSNNCFSCHGPDEGNRKAGLRLDRREGAIADLGGYAAVVPGKPDESMLLMRIAADDPAERMPPPHAKKPRLTESQVELMRAWIQEGASYDEHWAFQPLDTSEPPEVQDRSWTRNGIDRFILARLQEEGLQPSQEADRATLIRRVSLDLTGLLPTPAEVRQFEHDSDPAAYEKLVDRLLASPHYGERWGRHWLDQARYADSNGYTIDSDRAMWPYRDWVIKAHNDDMPFDQFTLEQLAGDLLPSPTKNQLIATGFHRNTLINEEGGTDAEQFRHESVVDRVNTTGAVWLGLTVGCAQCHTHKFDPIPHRDYYQLFAFFNQTSDNNNKGPTVNVTQGEVFGVLPQTATAENQQTAGREGQQVAWEKSQLELLDAQSEQAVQWSPARYQEYDTKTGAGFQFLEDNSLLSDGRGAFNDTYRVRATSELDVVKAVRLRVLTHESLPKGGPGRASNGNFVLTDFTVTLDGEQLSIASAYADHSQPGYPITAAIDNDSKSGWAINVAKGSLAQLNADHEAIFVLETPVPLRGRALEFGLFHDANENYLVGRFAIELSAQEPSAVASFDPSLVKALRTPRGKRKVRRTRLVREAFEQFAGEAQAADKKPSATSETAEAMIMRRAEQPRTTYVYQRGDFLRPDLKLGPLNPGTLSAVPPALPSSPELTRIDLAKWLIDPQNPLTPRVTMNRMWMRYFGRGLVETEDDFGAQGAPPTHPRLLDWLAREFMDRGWSLKSMHRLIVTSATYRQSSAMRPDLLERDPRNLLLARQERLRMEAEIVRDAALSASGLLVETIGGPSVRPPQPAGVYAFTQTDKKWVAADDGDRYRRALYTVFYRSAPYPLFTTFDAPDFQTVCTRRVRSNTPLQALTVANDEAFLELARGLARRVAREVPADDVDARLEHAFRLCVARAPSLQERELLKEYFERQQTYFAARPADAAELLRADPAASDSSLPDKAAWLSVSRVLFNTDNFITRE